MARRAALMSSRDRRRFRRRINRTSRGPLKRQIALVRTRVRRGAKGIKRIGAWVGKSTHVFCAGREESDLVVTMSDGGGNRLHRGWEWLPSGFHRPKRNQPSREAYLCLTLLSVTLMVLVWRLGREVAVLVPVGMATIQKTEAAWMANYVDEGTEGMLRIGVYHLLHTGGVAACTNWCVRAVVSAYARGLWVAGAKVAILETGSTLDSGNEEEEGAEEEQRKEDATRGNPFCWDVNRPRDEVARRSTKASLEAGRLRRRAAVRLQSKVFCLYLYD